VAAVAAAAAAPSYVVVPGAAVAASPAFELFARAVRHALAMWRAPQMLLEQLALDAEVKRLKNAILAGFSSFRGAVAAVEAVRVTSRVSTLREPKRANYATLLAPVPRPLTCALSPCARSFPPLRLRSPDLCPVRSPGSLLGSSRAPASQ
jgi:hypothetical protein